MSAPPSPRIGHTANPTVLPVKRDRPAGLTIHDEDRKAASDGEVRYEREFLLSEEKATKQVISDASHVSTSLLIFSGKQGFNMNISSVDDAPLERDQTTSRSASTTSSLDPYYFGAQSEYDSPLPPMPPVPAYLSTTPDPPLLLEPVTPARNPAAIDRRGLVGVGELATPRWAREERTSDHEELPSDYEIEGYEIVVPDEIEDDQPDSPWTIEAVDGEMSEREEVRNAQFRFRAWNELFTIIGSECPPSASYITTSTFHSR